MQRFKLPAKAISHASSQAYQDVINFAMKLFSISHAIIQMEWMHTTIIFQLLPSFIIVMTKLDMIMKSSPWCTQTL